MNCWWWFQSKYEQIGADAIKIRKSYARIHNKTVNSHIHLHVRSKTHTHTLTKQMETHRFPWRVLHELAHWQSRTDMLWFLAETHTIWRKKRFIFSVEFSASFGKFFSFVLECVIKPQILLKSLIMDHFFDAVGWFYQVDSFQCAALINDHTRFSRPYQFISINIRRVSPKYTTHHFVQCAHVLAKHVISFCSFGTYYLLHGYYSMNGTLFKLILNIVSSST